MGQKLRFGIVGCGGIFQWGHLPALKDHPDVEIVALCDIVLEKAQKHAKDLGVKNVFADYRDLVKLADVDVVDICTPNLFHSEVAVAALDSGKHVFTEKPDAISPEEAQKMADAARKSGKLLMAMRNQRYNWSSQFVKKYIDAGSMGEIYTGRCGWTRRRGIPGKGGWFTTKSISGGGPLIDLGVHMIDVATWLMGSPKPVAVSGSTYRKFSEDNSADSIHSSFGEKKADGVFDVEDLAIGFVRFENGASLQVECSWASNIGEEKHFVELRGTKAGVSIDSGEKCVIHTEMQGTLVDIHPRAPRNPANGHTAYLHHYVDCLKGRATPIMRPEDGVDMIKILSALYRSAAEGKEVRL